MKLYNHGAGKAPTRAFSWLKATTTCRYEIGSPRRFVSSPKREALYDDIPYIDEDDPDPEPDVGGDNDGAGGEDESQADNFSFGKLFWGQGRRKKSVEVRVPQS